MDATLASRRNQLFPLENHWNSLHFQCASLMRIIARLRHPAVQSGNVTVIGKSPKTLAAVTFNVSEMPAAGLKIWRRCFRWFTCGLNSAQYIRKPFKTIGNHSISKHPRKNAEHNKGSGHRGGVLGKKDCGPGFGLGGSAKLIPRHAI